MSSTVCIPFGEVPSSAPLLFVEGAPSSAGDLLRVDTEALAVSVQEHNYIPSHRTHMYSESNLYIWFISTKKFNLPPWKTPPQGHQRALQLQVSPAENLCNSTERQCDHEEAAMERSCMIVLTFVCMWITK